jgi:hypothetical protein
LTERSPDVPFWQVDWSGNKMIAPILAATLGTLAIAMYVPAAAHVLRMAPVSLDQLGLAVAAGFLSTIWFEPFKRRAAAAS